MGDRSQIAIKDGDAKFYLYSHWGGTEIYTTLQNCIKKGERLDDTEYFARIVFREMGAGAKGETGFGIGTGAHSDIEHLIPVVDCETQTITFEIPECRQRPNPGNFTFEEFAMLPAETLENW
jgi:hypothetical protein